MELTVISTKIVGVRKAESNNVCGGGEGGGMGLMFFFFFFYSVDR